MTTTKTQNPKNAQDLARWTLNQMRKIETDKAIPSIDLEAGKNSPEMQKRLDDSFEANFTLVTGKSEIENFLGDDTGGSVKAMIIIGWSDWDGAMNLWELTEQIAEVEGIQVKREVETSFGEFSWNVITFHKNRGVNTFSITDGFRIAR